MLSDLGGKPYGQLREHLSELKGQENPLVDRVADSWHLVSPEDAWIFLTQHLTKDDLNRLQQASERVLGERDPAFDLDPGDSGWQMP